MTRRSITLIAMTSSAALLAFTSSKAAPVLVWNASRSAPIGLYYVQPAGALFVTTLVLAMPPEPLASSLARGGYLPRGVPLLKRILALPGHSVCRDELIISVDESQRRNGTRAGPPRPSAPRLAGLSNHRRRRGVPHELGRAGVARQPLLRPDSHIRNHRSRGAALDIREGLDMAFLCNVLALHLPDQERVGGANFGGTALAGAPIIVGAASRVPCVLQMRRSCAVHSARCQRAFVLQTNRARPAAETRTRQQPKHQAAVCFCGDRPGGGWQ